MFYHFQVIWRWIIMTLERSLKVIQTGIPFESLGAVSYSPSIVTIAVSLPVYEIFSVKVLRDLENWVRCCSRSLKRTPFDRPYTTFYWSAIVSIAVCCTISSYLTLNNHDFGKVTEGHSNWYTIRKLGRGFLFAFHSNYSCIFTSLWDIQRQSIAWPWKLG